jgi:hypothetical protein
LTLKTPAFAAGVIALWIVLIGATITYLNPDFLSYSGLIYVIITGVLTSALAAFLLDILPRIFNGVGRWREQREFLSFFGIVTNQTRGAILVFSYRKLRDVEDQDDTQRWITTSEVSALQQKYHAVAEGLNGWVPLQDLRGANYVAR